MQRLWTGLGFAALALLPLLAFMTLSLREPAPLRTTLIADDATDSVLDPVPAEPSTPAVAAFGRLHSKPQGAEVWADGELRGQTPYELGAEALSWSEIVLVREGYQRLRIEPSVLQASNELALFELEPAKTEARPRSRPRRAKAKPQKKKKPSATQSVLVDPWDAHD